MPKSEVDLLDFAVLAEESWRELVLLVDKSLRISLNCTRSEVNLGSLEGQIEICAGTGMGDLESTEGRTILIRMTEAATSLALHGEEHLSVVEEILDSIDHRIFIFQRRIVLEFRVEGSHQRPVIKGGVDLVFLVTELLEDTLSQYIDLGILTLLVHICHFLNDLGFRLLSNLFHGNMVYISAGGEPCDLRLSNNSFLSCLLRLTLNPLGRGRKKRRGLGMPLVGISYSFCATLKDPYLAFGHLITVDTNTASTWIVAKHDINELAAVPIPTIVADYLSHGRTFLGPLTYKVAKVAKVANHLLGALQG